MKLKDSAKVTYTYYSIALDGKTKATVNTLEEAEKIVNNIKQETGKDLDLKLSIVKEFTEQTQQYEIANTESLDNEIKNMVAEAQKIASCTVNGVALTATPVEGKISSRFGVYSNIRSGAHTGIDIPGKIGTPIKTTASGTVTYSGYKGSYGNLVIISHGNNVETYYAHCNEIYVTKGKKVQVGEIIAAVGSTGNSTGPHLHLEIRINGKCIDPQKYLYK